MLALAAMVLRGESEGVELPLVLGTEKAVPEAQAQDTRNSRERRYEYVALAALMLAMSMEGWNDGTIGPLIPTVQSYYEVNYTVVSLIFVFKAVGFISAAVANIYLSEKLGFGKTLVIGAAAQTFAYCLQAPAPPFPVFALANIFSGFGSAIQNAQSMSFAVSLHRGSATKVAILLATHGVGALSAPLIATQFISSTKWSYYFLVLVGLGIVDLVALSLVFKFQHLDAVLVKLGQSDREKSTSQDSHYSQIFKLKVVHLLAIFALVYVGAENAIGGWIVTFVMVERNGGPASGYISTGFYAGMTLGRVGLVWLNKIIGERRIVWLYILLSMGLEISIWFVPSLIENAIAVSFVGLFFGPIYPIVMNTAGRLVPHWLISGVAGVIAAVGQTGTALIPFIAGAMASEYGIWSLHPLVIGASSILLVLWTFVPPV